MNFPKKVMLGSVLLLGATSVFADTADLRVTGTIAPGACTPVFVGGAVVDYGIIPISSLSKTEVTAIGTKDIGYTITCNAPIPISTTWTDSRAGTASAASVYNFGLGNHNGVPIGLYTMNFRNGATADGNPVDIIERLTPGSAWINNNSGGAYNGVGHDGREHSYASPGTLSPGAYSVYTGVLAVTARINRTDALDLTTEVTLDGLSTMTVNYL
ncbi:DUF1120 domain-containing protein [Pseudomonas chlororaphis]